MLPITRVTVTLLIGPVVAVPAPAPLMEALQGITVTTSVGSRSGFQLSFTLANQSPLYGLLLVAANAALLALRVIVVATVNGTPEVLTDGVITRQEVTPGPSAGTSTLTVTGEDISTVMDRQEMNGIPYPAMPAEARVAAILAKYAAYGVIPAVVPSLFLDVPIPVDEIPTQQGTDYAYITALATEVGYTFYVEAGPVPGTNLAYWGPQVKAGLVQPALSVDMGPHTNVESLTFSIAHNEKSMPVVFIHEKSTKATIPIPIPDVNPLQPPLGLAPSLPSKLDFMTDTAKLSPVAALARGVARAAASADTVEGSGTLDVVRYGRLLKARQLVGVRGAGLAFDGLYYVKSVTSTLRAGAFTQTFALSRNALIANVPAVPV